MIPGGFFLHATPGVNGDILPDALQPVGIDPGIEGRGHFPQGHAVSDTSTGVDARLSSVLCYAGWWITGLVFLFAERRHAGVRFHAAQSIVVFGAFSLALFLTGGVSAVAFILVGPLFQLVQTVGYVLWLAAVVLWLYLLLTAWRGEMWQVPLAGNLAKRMAR